MAVRELRRIAHRIARRTGHHAEVDVDRLHYLVEVAVLPERVEPQHLDETRPRPQVEAAGGARDEQVERQRGEEVDEEPSARVPQRDLARREDERAVDDDARPQRQQDVEAALKSLISG